MTVPTMPDWLLSLGPKSRLYCHECGKSVSTEFYPVITGTPDKGIIVRAFIQCPECMEKDSLDRKATTEKRDA